MVAEMVLDEHRRATDGVLRVTGQQRLLEHRPDRGTAVQLRNPYVDALSYLGLRALRTLRSGTDLPASGPRLPERLLQLSVSGVAAGLQNTG